MIFGYFCAKSLRNKNPKTQCFQPLKGQAGTAAVLASPFMSSSSRQVIVGY